MLAGEIGASLHGHLFETAVTEVAQQDGPLLPPALAGRKAVGMPVHENQVFPAVMVHVKKTGPPADVQLPNGGDAGGCRRKCEERPALRVGPLAPVEGRQLIFVVFHPKSWP